MKLLHLADLHIGKRLHEYSLLEDQRNILEQIIGLVKKEKPDGVMIAGDVYDKSIPQESSILLFDYFLTELNRHNVPVFVVSGNHDSGERLHFGGGIMKNDGIYIAGYFHGQMDKITVEDEWGPVNIYLLPFLKPSMARRYYEGVETYQDGIEAVISHTNLDLEQRNVLIAHQFVTNGSWIPEQYDSETGLIGGLDHVDCEVFQDFDYVALGHLHGPQKVGSEYIRYAGSPLKYSFSEAFQKKSVAIIELKEKGNRNLNLFELVPMREVRQLKGALEELIKPKYSQAGNREDYIRVILTDQEELYAPMEALRNRYPNILCLEFENRRTSQAEYENAEKLQQKSMMELFEEFYSLQNGKEMDQEQKKLAADIWKGEENRK